MFDLLRKNHNSTYLFYLYEDPYDYQTLYTIASIFDIRVYCVMENHVNLKFLYNDCRMNQYNEHYNCMF